MGVGKKERHLRATNTIQRHELDHPELKKLYEAYLLSVSLGHFLPFVGIVAQAQKHDQQTTSQIPLHLAWLQALAQPEQPFSLMVKSVWEHHNVMKPDS